jgi:hypothetical protein
MIKSATAQAQEIANAGDDFETALADPAAYYADPQAILADGKLSLAQKRRFLSEWEQDLTDRQVADQEGMTATDSMVQDADADLQNRIHDALKRLETESDSEEAAPPRRWWQRLRAA